MLILQGGTDISPSIYGQTPLKWTQQSDVERDIREENLIDEAIENKQPIIGICRGAQFLCVKAGGSLYQHSEGHNCSHDVTVIDPKNNHMAQNIKNAAAGHHQIMRLGTVEHVIYGYSVVPTKVYISNTESKVLLTQPEIVFFPLINALAIQPHPEWMSPNHPFNLYIKDLILHLFGEKNVTF